MVLLDAASGKCDSAVAHLVFYSLRIILNMVFVPITGGYILQSFMAKFKQYEKLAQEERAAASLAAEEERREREANQDDPEKKQDGDGEAKSSTELSPGSEAGKDDLSSSLGMGDSELKTLSRVKDSDADGTLEHIVYLVQRNGLSSEDEIRAAWIGVAAAEKQRKYERIALRNEKLSLRVGEMEEVTRISKRKELKMSVQVRRLTAELEKVKNEVWELRKQVVAAQ